jgi:hypothetical protein
MIINIKSAEYLCEIETGKKNGGIGAVVEGERDTERIEEREK